MRAGNVRGGARPGGGRRRRGPRHADYRHQQRVGRRPRPAGGTVTGFENKTRYINIFKLCENWSQVEGPTGFTPGSALRLAALHAPAADGRPAQLQVWLEGQGGRRGRRAAVDLTPDQANDPRLKFASSIGPVDLVQGETWLKHLGDIVTN